MKANEIVSLKNKWRPHCVWITGVWKQDKLAWAAEEKKITICVPKCWNIFNNYPILTFRMYHLFYLKKKQKYLEILQKR